MADRTLQVRITGDASGLGRAVKKAQADTAGFEGSLSRPDSAVGKANRNFTAFRNTVQLVKFPAMIAGAGMAAQAVSALGAAAVATSASLAPLSGAVAAYPALLSSMAQGMGVAKLASKGLSEAIGGDEEAMKRLTGEGQQFVRLIQRLKPEFDAIANRAQRGLLPGVEDGVRKASRALPVLADVVSGTSRAMGALAARSGALVGSRGFLRDLETQGRRNQTTISRLGGAAISMGNALRHVTLAAGPLVGWLTRMGEQFAKLINRQAASARESGQMARFFDQTRVALSRVARIAADVAGALFNIGKAGKPLGDELLVSLTKNADKFREWTESARGRNAIAEWFEQARTPIYELAKLLRDATQAFFRLGRGDLAGPMIRQIRTQMLPALEEVVASTTKAFGPHLISALTNIVRLFGQLAGTSGPLTNFVRLIGGVAGAMADLLENNSGMRTVVTTMIGFAGVMKAIQFAGAVTGIASMGRMFISMAGGARTAVTALRTWRTTAIAARAATLATTAALYAQRVAMIASAAATRGMAIAMRIFNLAIRANPVVAVVSLIIALGAAMVLAYKKSETFRNIVNGALRGVARGAKAMASAMVDAFNFVRRLPGRIADIFNNVVRAVSRFIGRATNAAERVGRGIIDGVVNFVKRLPGRAWDLFVDTLRKIGQFERRAITAAVDMGKNFVKSVVRGLGNLGHAILNKIKDAFGFVKDKAGDLIGSVGDLFGDGIGKKVGDGVGRRAKGNVGSAAIPKGGGGGLKGSNRALGGFLATAKGISRGLYVGSGIRPGSVTRSGNTSYHSTGEAIDVFDTANQGGPSPAKLKFFNTMKNRFGKHLAELIYTPGGTGIWQGKSHTYTGQTAADHFDHVHVALDLGKPGVGIGDGIGRPGGDGPGATASKMGPLRIIAAAAKAADISPAILYGVWGAESGFDMNPPRSTAGAQGPFQFMPPTAKSMGVNPYDFRSAAFGAARYLAQYESRGTAGMLAAYNAGPAGNPNNPETRAYIPKVLGYAKRWASVAPKGGGGTDVGGTDGGGDEPARRGPPQIREEDQSVARIPGGRVPGIRGIDPKKPLKIGKPVQGLTVGSAGALELGLAESDEMLSRAEGTDGLEDDRAALRYRLTAMRARLKKIRRSLKNDVRSPATRGRLLGEAAQLRRDIRETLAALRALGVDAANQSAEADAIEASLTPDLQDDLSVAQTELRRRESDYAKAKRSGNKSRIVETGQALQAARQNVQSAREAIQSANEANAASAVAGLQDRLDLVDLQERAGDLTSEQALAQRIHLRQQALAGYFGPLSDRERLQIRGDLRENTQALQDNTQAMQDYTNALKVLTEEVALSNQIALRVQETESFQLKKYLADVLSGQIGGYGLAGRRFTPGTGVEVAY